MKNICRRYALRLAICALIGSVWLAARLSREPILAGVTFSKQVNAADGTMLRMTLSGDEKYRVYTPLDEIPEEFQRAVLLHEDQWFYMHPGVNPWALLRAGMQTYLRGGRRVGGSTITMQLARMTSTRGSKTLSGKLFQILRAFKFELLHDKNEIFEAYLNLLPYGANIEGIGAASLVYFNRPAMRLTLGEILTLALVPQNPNERRPLSTGLNHALVRAREELLQLWIKKHPEDRALDLTFPLMTRASGALPFEAPHFVNHALERAASRSYREGRIDTTLDRAIQAMVEKKLTAYVRSHLRLGIKNGAAMIVNHESMEVIALVGSVDFWNAEIEGQVNGTRGKRSPGSSLKPFVYAMAFDQGLIHPMTLLKDTPMSFGGFDPENYDRGFAGPVHAGEALINSRNIPAVFLNARLKEPSFYEFLKSGGVSRLKEANYYGLTTVLGGAEVTMEEMVKLYAMLANRGELKELRYFKSQEADQPIAKLFSPEAAFMTLDILLKNERGDQKHVEEWMRDSVPVAWKTGTSYGFRDAWTSGIVGPYVISVWLGDFAGESNPSLVGRELAAPLFFSLVDGLKGRAGGEARWASALGLNIKKVEVCALSGALPGKHCSHRVATWFIPGKSPIATCAIHREIQLTAQGYRSCDENKASGRRRVFEFWPSDLLQVFRSAGIARKNPPSFEPGCRSAEVFAGGVREGLKPEITSPRSEVHYALRVTAGREAEHNEIVPLAAVADGDVRFLHWFVGTEYLGKSAPQEPLFWRPRPGRYVVRVVDDLGRSDERQVDVRVSQ